MRCRMSRLFPDKKRSDRQSGQWGQQGMSLPEAAIGLLIFSLLILAVVGWMSQFNRTARMIGQKVQTSAMGQTAIRLMREDFRSMQQLIGSGDELHFLNLRNEQILYYLSENRNLIRSVNRQGSSVIAVDVRDWHVRQIGEQLVEVTVTIGTGETGTDKTTEIKAILAGRGGKAAGDPMEQKNQTKQETSAGTR